MHEAFAKRIARITLSKSSPAKRRRYTGMAMRNANAKEKAQVQRAMSELNERGPRMMPKV